MSKILLIMIVQLTVVHSMSIEHTNGTKTQDNRIQELENVVQSLESRIQILNETNQLQRVRPEKFIAFYAILTETKHLEIKSTVVFDKTILNRGEYYNKYDGIFIAPISGIYLFSWSVCTIDSFYAFTELVIENTVISRAGEYESQGYRDCGSITALCRMEKDDHAWIRTTEYSHASKTHYIFVEPHVSSTSFMGMIINSD